MNSFKVNLRDITDANLFLEMAARYVRGVTTRIEEHYEQQSEVFAPGFLKGSAFDEDEVGAVPKFEWEGSRRGSAFFNILATCLKILKNEPLPEESMLLPVKAEKKKLSKKKRKAKLEQQLAAIEKPPPPMTPEQVAIFMEFMTMILDKDNSDLFKWQEDQLTGAEDADILVIPTQYDGDEPDGDTDWNEIRTSFLEFASEFADRFPTQLSLKFSKRASHLSAHLLSEALQPDLDDSEDSDDSEEKKEQKSPKASPIQQKRLECLIQYHSEKITSIQIQASEAEFLKSSGEVCSEQDLLVLQTIEQKLCQHSSLQGQLSFFFKSGAAERFSDVCCRGKFAVVGDPFEKEKVKIVSSILSTLLVPQTRFKVEDEAGQHYEVRDAFFETTITLKKWKKLFNLQSHAINFLLTRTKSHRVQLLVLRALKRLYFDIVPRKHKNLFQNTFITSLENIAELGSAQKTNQAAIVLYTFLHMSPKLLTTLKSKDLVASLRANDSFEILKFSSHFSAYYSLDLVEQTDPAKVSATAADVNLPIAGFPLRHEIDPESFYNQYIHVQSDRSVLVVEFQVGVLNIGFSVSRITGFEYGPIEDGMPSCSELQEQSSEPIVAYEIVEASPKFKRFVVKVGTGLLKVTWHNEYSQTSSKVVQASVRLLEAK